MDADRPARSIALAAILSKFRRLNGSVSTPLVDHQEST